MAVGSAYQRIIGGLSSSMGLRSGLLEVPDVGQLAQILVNFLAQLGGASELLDGVPKSASSSASFPLLRSQAGGDCRDRGFFIGKRNRVVARSAGRRKLCGRCLGTFELLNLAECGDSEMPEMPVGVALLLDRSARN